jgi:probable blue pigment (indigoidine) exporter
VKRTPATGAIAAVTVLAPVAWGTTYLTVTALLPPGRPLLVAVLRVVPAGLALLLVDRRRGPWRPHGRDWARAAAVGFCSFGAFFPLLVVAVHRLPGGVAAAAGGIQPLLVVLMTWAVARRRPRRAEVVAGAVAVVGVALVVLRPGASFDPVGVLAAVGANVSFAAGVVLTRRFPAPERPLALIGWQLLIAGALLVPLLLVVEGPPPPLSPVNLAGAAYLSLVATAAAFAVWTRGVRRLPVVAPPLLGLAAPLTGAALGWVLAGQHLSPVQVVGFGVTLAAIGYGAVLPGRKLKRRGVEPSPDLACPPHGVVHEQAEEEGASPPEGRDAGEHGLRGQGSARLPRRPVHLDRPGRARDPLHRGPRDHAVTAAPRSPAGR